MREESVCWFVRSSPEEGGNEEGTCDKKTRSRLGSFAACAGKHYFVIGTKAAFLAYPC